MMNKVDLDKEVAVRPPKLMSIANAADELGVHQASIRRHFPLVRIGDRTLVRVADVEAKIAEGQVDAA